MVYNMNIESLTHWVFAKSLSGQYLFMSENLAEFAGFDSPGRMIGLRDSDTIWKDQAECFRQGDIEAFKGKVLINRSERIRFAKEPDKIRELLVTKTALRDKQNEIIGVVGSAIDITPCNILQHSSHFDGTEKKSILKNPLSELTFSKKQKAILQYMIMGYSAAEIGHLLNRSKRTIEGHIEQLKNKLQCTSKAEIIRWAVTSGLLHDLDWSSK